ncbi:hypothetical protein H9L39_10998 [Fusarium oxysporum f. sp. albedinis]|nr:hypothetical protein H9L39_10998 [Fusarium oxysporum f. sp. albedinis]
MEVGVGVDRSMGVQRICTSARCCSWPTLAPPCWINTASHDQHASPGKNQEDFTTPYPSMGDMGHWPLIISSGPSVVKLSYIYAMIHGSSASSFADDLWAGSH